KSSRASRISCRVAKLADTAERSRQIPLMRSSSLAPAMRLSMSFRPKLLTVTNPGRSSSSKGSGIVRSVMSCLRSISSSELAATVVSLSALMELTRAPMMIKPTTNSRINEITIPVTVASTYLKNDFIFTILRCSNLEKLHCIDKCISCHNVGLTMLRPIRYRNVHLDINGHLAMFAYRKPLDIAFYAGYNEYLFIIGYKYGRQGCPT